MRSLLVLGEESLVGVASKQIGKRGRWIGTKAKKLLI
jgi:hypothetical protein